MERLEINAGNNTCPNALCSMAAAQTVQFNKSHFHTQQLTQTKFSPPCPCFEAGIAGLAGVWNLVPECPNDGVSAEPVPHEKKAETEPTFVCNGPPFGFFVKIQKYQPSRTMIKWLEAEQWASEHMFPGHKVQSLFQRQYVGSKWSRFVRTWFGEPDTVWGLIESFSSGDVPLDWVPSLQYKTSFVCTDST